MNNVNILLNLDKEDTITWNIEWENVSTDDFMNFLNDYMPDMVDELVTAAQEQYDSSFAMCASSADKGDDDSPSETYEVMTSDE